jgi:hypothetical protein
MVRTQKPDELLQKLFQKTKVVTLVVLLKTINSTSRVTIFRHLKNLGYHSSFSHSGKYYTLKNIPRFDKNGIWFHKNVGFARDRSLSAAILRLVEVSKYGMTHGDLKSLLRIDVFNTLTQMVDRKVIRREKMDNGRFFYVSMGAKVGDKQFKRRIKTMRSDFFPTDAEAVLILVELIKAPSSSIRELAMKLSLQGLRIAEQTIENLLSHHGLLKKTSDMRP